MTDGTDGELTGALTMTEVRRMLRELDGDAFVERLGHAFLLYHAPTEGAGASFLGRTVALEKATNGTGGTETLVLPVRPSGRSLFPDFISVGRAQKNDVIISDPSLSKFHAYFRHNDEQGYTLLDADSQNGTFLNDEPVPTQKTGEAVAVAPGSRLRFGGANCTFLSAESLRIVAMMAGNLG